MRHEAPYQQLRNAYWQWLTEFKNNHGYMSRSHTFDNFLLFIEVKEIELTDSNANVWNWYF